MVGQDTLPFAVPEGSTLSFEPTGSRSEEEVIGAMLEEEFDAVLRLQGSNDAELIVTREPLWKGELEALLTTERQRRALATAGLTSTQLQDLLAPSLVQVHFHEEATPSTSFGDKVAAGVLIGLMILGIFIGLSYQFIVITGEKQQRVTELVISAVSPQMWIDGKILGISLLAFASTVTYTLSVLIFVLFSHLFGDGLSMPMGTADPSLWLQLIPLALGGFLFWTTFFGLIAATIDDPNTSTRGGFLALPIVPLGAAFLGLAQPDSLLMKILAIFPLTSSCVMPVRLLLSRVAWWEYLLALLLLGGSIWFLRKAAGRVFRLAILMYGKEPTWGEIGRWIRES